MKRETFDQPMTPEGEQIPDWIDAVLLDLECVALEQSLPNLAEDLRGLRASYGLDPSDRRA